MVAISRTDLTNALRSPDIAPQRHEFAAAPPNGRTAIFAVHGVSPIQRYAFQDQVATALEAYLNAQEPEDSSVSWQSIVYWPECTTGDPVDIEGVRPSALRVYRSGDNPNDPKGRVYDVYEGYWSPLSKGKTNIASALRWLLNGTFLGTSSTATLPCTFPKLRFDLFYVLAFFCIALGCCGAAVALGWLGWWALAKAIPQITPDVDTYWGLLSDPLHTLLHLPLVFYIEFLIVLTLGYVAAQIIVVYHTGYSRQRNASTVTNDARKGGHFQEALVSAQRFHRAILAVLWALCAVFAALAWAVPFALTHALNSAYYGDSIWWLVFSVGLLAIAVGALQGARALADFAVENVLGDVQIYTTHDQNSSFYAIRQAIIAAVTAAFKGMMNVGTPLTPHAQAAGEEPEAYYHSIHILGHSLGSTIAMDVMILLRQMMEEKVFPSRHWDRIRSFTTFGTALEKTRFFFDVRQPTLNAAQDQWENDVYGKYFTNQRLTLNSPTNAAGIYWSNYWYLHDIVSNEIVSYQSDCSVGDQFNWRAATGNSTPHPICDNFPDTPPATGARLGSQRLLGRPIVLGEGRSDSDELSFPGEEAIDSSHTGRILRSLRVVAVAFDAFVRKRYGAESR